MEEKIMDVTEEITETIVEPVAEAAEGIDWAKCGIVAGGVALVAAGAYGAYKLAPKAAERIKTWKRERAGRKYAKKDKDTFGTDYVEVNDVDKNDN